MRGEVSRPRICLSGSKSAHISKPKANTGTDPVGSPLPSRSSCRSQRWIERPRECLRIASSFCPSQTASCCAQHGCCSTPTCHLPDSAPDTAAAPAQFHFFRPFCQFCCSLYTCNSRFMTIPPFILQCRTLPGTVRHCLEIFFHVIRFATRHG